MNDSVNKIAVGQMIPRWFNEWRKKNNEFSSRSTLY